MRPSSSVLLLVLPVLSFTLVGWWLGKPNKGSTVPMLAAQKTGPAPKQPPPPAALMMNALEPVTAPTVPSAPVPTELSKLVADLKIARSKEECRRLAQAIVALGIEDAIEALWQAAIAQTNLDLRAGLLEGLDSVVEPKMITFTASVLKATAEPDILDAATQLVARGADMDTVGFLTDLYTEAGSTPLQQRHLAYAISEIRTEGAASALGALAQNVDQPLLAQAAAYSLFNLGTPNALRQLKEAKETLSGSSAPDAETLLQAIDQLMKPAADTPSPR